MGRTPHTIIYLCLSSWFFVRFLFFPLFWCPIAISRDRRRSKRREAVALLSGVAAALAGLATPAAVRCLGMTAIEAADEALVGSLCGVSHFLVEISAFGMRGNPLFSNCELGNKINLVLHSWVCCAGNFLFCFSPVGLMCGVRLFLVCRYRSWVCCAG